MSGERTTTFPAHLQLGLRRTRELGDGDQPGVAVARRGRSSWVTSGRCSRYLRRCAPWLGPEEVRELQRDEPRAWTVSDLPLLDAARQRLGDPEASRRRQAHRAAVAVEREQMDRVVDELLAARRRRGA